MNTSSTVELGSRSAYETAVQRTVDCLAEAGVEVGPIVESGLRIRPTPPDDVERLDDLDEWRPCAAEFLDEAESAYQVAHAPSIEEISDLLAEVKECLVERGYQIPAEVTGRALDRYISRATVDDLDVCFGASD